MARKTHKKRKHKRMDKKQRGERSGAIRARKRARKAGGPRFVVELRTLLEENFG